MSPDIAKYHLCSKINHWFQSTICKRFCEKKKHYKHSNADKKVCCKLYNSLYFNCIKYNDLLSFLFLVIHCLFTELSNVTKSQTVSSLFKIPINYSVISDMQIVILLLYESSGEKMLVFSLLFFYFKYITLIVHFSLIWMLLQPWNKLPLTRSQSFLMTGHRFVPTLRLHKSWLHFYLNFFPLFQFKKFIPIKSYLANTANISYHTKKQSVQQSKN